MIKGLNKSGCRAAVCVVGVRPGEARGVLPDRTQALLPPLVSLAEPPLKLHGWPEYLTQTQGMGDDHIVSGYHWLTICKGRLSYVGTHFIDDYPKGITVRLPSWPVVF